MLQKLIKEFPIHFDNNFAAGTMKVVPQEFNFKLKIKDIKPRCCRARPLAKKEMNIVNVGCKPSLVLSKC